MEHFLDEYGIEALQSGLVYEEETAAHRCLVCGARFADGEVFPLEGRFYTAECAAKLHAQSAHGDRFEQLLHSGSKYVTLTENQKSLLQMLYEGKSDAEIAAATQTAAATVRRQRFMFREKAKQAKMYLALYGFINEKKQPQSQRLVPVHGGATMLDERFMITEKENEKILSNAFESLAPMRLSRLPVKEKKKVAILNQIMTAFEREKDYTEKDVNAILKAIYPDYVTLRRYLIEYGYMGRTPSGSRYWVL